MWTGFCDEEALSKGVYKTYTEENLRYSQNAPLSMYEEVNTRCNLPAQIDIEATEGMEYKFLCVVKGGGSANKTYFYQETKAKHTEPRHARSVPRREDEDARNGGLPSLPYSLRNRRHVGREEPLDRQAGLNPLL